MHCVDVQNNYSLSIVHVFVFAGIKIILIFASQFIYVKNLTFLVFLYSEL